MARLFEGDTAPSILTYAVAGTPVDLAGYQFTLVIGYNTPLAKVGTNLDQVTDKGKFKITWVAGDLKAGTWKCQIRTQFPDGTVKTSDAEDLVIARRLA